MSKGSIVEFIINENELRTKKFLKDWFPLSTKKIVIVCPTFKSTGYIDFVLNSVQKFTKNVEFLFVANDATDRVKNYLKEHQINHIIYENDDKDEYYINRVYKAYNFGGMNANGDIIVFVNTDNAFSENWLENLLRHLKEDRIVCSRLVESGKLLSGKNSISKNFGRSYHEYNEEGFLKYARDIREKKLVQGGHSNWMPCAIYKNIFEKSGRYPPGNRTERSGKITSGDTIYFYETLKSIGVKPYTVFDSIVYHIQEGEKDE